MYYARLAFQRASLLQSREASGSPYSLRRSVDKLSRAIVGQLLDLPERRRGPIIHLPQFRSKSGRLYTV
jgi:hypothetical protein